MAKAKTKDAPAIETTSETVITAYKGFDKDFRCKGFQYEIGKTYTHDGDVEACASGFHACEYPLDVFNYYAPANSIYAQVEQEGKISKHDDDSKVASSKITIKGALSLPGLIQAAIEYTFSRSKPEGTGSSATGIRGAASATGIRGAASATGDQGAASATGYQGAASATGDQGSASAIGLNGKAKAGETGLLIVAWWDEKAERKRVTVGYVGEAGIKADTWYCADGTGALKESD